MACSSPSTREDPKHPDYYKKALHNPRNTDIEDIYKRLDGIVSAAEAPKLEAMVLALAAESPPPCARRST